jgi:hypothetical protein
VRCQPRKPAPAAILAFRLRRQLRDEAALVGGVYAAVARDEDRVRARGARARPRRARLRALAEGRDAVVGVGVVVLVHGARAGAAVGATAALERRPRIRQRRRVRDVVHRRQPRLRRGRERRVLGPQRQGVGAGVGIRAGGWALGAAVAGEQAVGAALERAAAAAAAAVAAERAFERGRALHISRGSNQTLASAHNGHSHPHAPVQTAGAEPKEQALPQTSTTAVPRARKAGGAPSARGA